MGQEVVPARRVAELNGTLACFFFVMTWLLPDLNLWRELWFPFPHLQPVLRFYLGKDLSDLAIMALPLASIFKRVNVSSIDRLPVLFARFGS